MHVPFTRLHLSLANLVSLLAILALVGACSGDSGILVEVTRDAESTPANIDRLRFYVGVGTGDRFLQDAEPLDDVELVADRDLEADPFELLLRDGISEAAIGEEVMVAVVGFSGADEVGFARLAEPVPFVDGEVVRWSLELAGEDTFEITDTGCAAFDGGVIAPTSDRDCDNDATPDDCDDENPEVGPSQDEVCLNDRDDNCNDQVDEETDNDEDGVTNCGGDCDDGNPAINPNAEELCDGIDNNCNARCDELFDADIDGFTVCGSLVEYKDEDGDGEPSSSVCLEEPAELTIDCNDEVAAINPDAPEICDGIDNDCNAECDDGFDADEDLYTTCGTKLPACNPVAPDCAPDNPDVNPGAAEVCDGTDTNCDGQPFPAVDRCYATVDVGGNDVCFVGARTCDDVNGGGFEGPCNVEGAPDEAEAVPGELCEAYAQCEAEGSLDPLACANRTVLAARSVDCTVAVTDAGVCPEASVPAVSPGDPPCTWAIVGGTNQRQYVAGFGEDAPLAARVEECESTFTIASAGLLGPRNDTFLLFRKDAAVAVGELIRVRLSPTFGNACPEVPLTCAISPEPTVGN